MDFQRNDKEKSFAWSEWIEVVEHSANITNHALIAITTFYITWYSIYFGFLSNITVHAWCSTIGYQLFMSEGIMALYSKNTYTIPVKQRSMKKRFHWILQAIASFMAIFGSAFEFYKREVGSRPHFSSFHSVTGEQEFPFSYF
jgi:Eukaryotic cytochrome b561